MQTVILLTYDDWGSEECPENFSECAGYGPHWGETFCQHCNKERPLRLATADDIRAKADEIEKQMAGDRPPRRLKDASGLVIII